MEVINLHINLCVKYIVPLVLSGSALLTVKNIEKEIE